MEDTISVSPPVGASVWETQLFTYLTEHMRREGEMLEEAQLPRQLRGTCKPSSSNVEERLSEHVLAAPEALSEPSAHHRDIR